METIWLPEVDLGLRQGTHGAVAILVADMLHHGRRLIGVGADNAPVRTAPSRDRGRARLERQMDSGLIQYPATWRSFAQGTKLCGRWEGGGIHRDGGGSHQVHAVCRRSLDPQSYFCQAAGPI